MRKYATFSDSITILASVTGNRHLTLPHGAGVYGVAAIFGGTQSFSIGLQVPVDAAESAWIRGFYGSAQAFGAIYQITAPNLAAVVYNPATLRVYTPSGRIRWYFANGTTDQTIYGVGSVEYLGRERDLAAWVV